jgi:hypothetical protein
MEVERWCARRLHTWGARAQVVAHPAQDFAPIPAHQLDTIQRLQIPVIPAEAVNKRAHAGPVLLVDGLIGYRLH